MEYSQIHILDELVARQIAAGEVIDRPSSVLRELIDNSIDSGATRIEVIVKGMGLDLIQVSDNGIGIKKDDLKISCLPHATSKIITNADLSKITSMGFRGEALPSIAAVSRLTITSRNAEDVDAWTVVASHTTISDAQKASRAQGTTVKAEYLFQDIPARRNFLSSPQTELNHLKNIFLTKAVPFPEIAFSFQSESQSIKLPQETPLARSIRIASNNTAQPDFVFLEYTEQTYGENTFGISASLGFPHIAQKNRRHIHIYINKRPVKEFSILQAVEYAYRHVLHGQKYPQAIVFLSIPPHLLDVNIHPAKSEVKIRSIDSVRKLVISNIEKSLLHISSAGVHFEPTQISLQESSLTFTSDKSDKLNISNKPEDKPKHKPENKLDKPHTLFPSDGQPHTPPKAPAYSYPQKSSNTEDNTVTSKYVSYKSPHHTQFNAQLLSTLNSNTPSFEETQTQSWKYKTCIFDTYLIFEYVDNNEKKKILLLDFHAAHERLIYDTLIGDSGTTSLLVPIPLHLDTDKESTLSLIEQYKTMHIIIEQQDTQDKLVAIPSNSPIDADNIARIIEENHHQDTINAQIFASRACRKAAKAGDHVDKEGAYKLLEDVLSLDVPRCPHGRPLWIEIDKYQLDKMIGRTE